MIKPIVVNTEETVGKARINDDQVIGYFDLAFLKEWIEELMKITPKTKGDKQIICVSFDPNRCYSACYGDSVHVLIGRPLIDFQGKIGLGCPKDVGIVIAPWFLSGVEEI